MKFKVTEANRMYHEMFHEPLDEEAIRDAKSMTDKQFDDDQPGIDEDGEYLESSFSAGQWDCIDAARN